MRNNPWCGDEGARAILSSKNLVNLTHLDLSANGIGDISLQTPHITNLSTLILESNRLDVESARTLAGNGNFKNLTKLSLAHTHMRDSGVQLIAKSAYLTDLVYLNLFHTGIGDSAVVALTKSENVQNVQSLYLGGNASIGSASGHALEESP